MGVFGHIWVDLWICANHIGGFGGNFLGRGPRLGNLAKERRDGKLIYKVGLSIFPSKGLSGAFVLCTFIVTCLFLNR